MAGSDGVPVGDALLHINEGVPNGGVRGSKKGQEYR
jgi:hypothetical protein